MGILEIINQCKKGCDCGRVHETAIQDIKIGSGLVHKVGEILANNDFPKNLLLVCDKNTLKASRGIEESLSAFSVEYKIYDDLRVATMENVVEIEAKEKPFDENLHEAVARFAAGEQMKGKVIDVVERGYMIGDKVLRFAKVVVGE
jgi:molecular chaperone GrpE (heat shock protein)